MPFPAEMLKIQSCITQPVSKYNPLLGEIVMHSCLKAHCLCCEGQAALCYVSY